MRYRRPANEEIDAAMPDDFVDLAQEKGEAKVRRMYRGIMRREAQRKGPVARLRALSYQKAGDSITFPEYQRSSQLGSMLATVSDLNNARFQCTREYSLVDGTPYVRVTLVKEAD